MKKYEFFSPLKGGKAIITIDENNITISRPGIMSKLSMGFKGDKIIPIKNITAVQVKLCDFTRGYIQFSLAGEVAKNVGILNGKLDENIVYFDGSGKNSKYNEYATEIKNAIEQFNSNNNANQQKETDNYDKLYKLKELLDQNIITQEEFEKEKKKLLD